MRHVSFPTPIFNPDDPIGNIDAVRRNLAGRTVAAAVSQPKRLTQPAAEGKAYGVLTNEVR